MNTNIRTARFAPVFRGGAARTAAALMAMSALVFSGCEDSGGYRSRPPADDREPNLQVTVVDALHQPIVGALATLEVNGTQQQAATDQDGRVTFFRLPQGPVTVTIAADGYEEITMDDDVSKVDISWLISLDAVGAWAVGRAVVLNTELLQLADDGSSMRFAVDIAVVAGEDAEPVLTLTEADFSIYAMDCSWGGPRDCASDINGNAATGFGVYQTDGIAREFEPMPGPARKPYIAGMLVARSATDDQWAVKGPAMKEFFSNKNHTDVIGLASVQQEGEVTTLTVLDPFTNDAAIYNDAVDQLALPASDYPQMFDELLDAIRWTGEAASDEFANRDASLLVLAYVPLSMREIREAAALAREYGVRISSISGLSYGNYGMPEIAARTGGTTMSIDRLRQYEQLFGVMDSVLSRSIPFYRMQFELTGIPRTFVAGGNARVYMNINVPRTVVSGDVFTSFDVAIPDAG